MLLNIHQVMGSGSQDFASYKPNLKPAGTKKADLHCPGIAQRAFA
jgi:hypothetical protein